MVVELANSVGDAVPANFRIAIVLTSRANMGRNVSAITYVAGIILSRRQEEKITTVVAAESLSAALQSIQEIPGTQNSVDYVRLAAVCPDTPNREAAISDVFERWPQNERESADREGISLEHACVIVDTFCHGEAHGGAHGNLQSDLQSDLQSETPSHMEMA